MEKSNIHTTKISKENSSIDLPNETWAHIFQKRIMELMKIDSNLEISNEKNLEENLEINISDSKSSKEIWKDTKVAKPQFMDESKK